VVERADVRRAAGAGDSKPGAAAAAGVGVMDRKAVMAMPRGDGTGPPRGGGRGRGRRGGPSAAGPGGQCICPKCGHKVPHVVGRPCNQQTCPKCGTAMTRG
jgi:hypothetical protein